jgi:membrane protease YdiL (CAAX protease family)
MAPIDVHPSALFGEKMWNGDPSAGGQSPHCSAQQTQPTSATSQQRKRSLVEPIGALLPLVVHRILEHVTLRFGVTWQELAGHLLPPLGMGATVVVLWRSSPPLPGERRGAPGHRALCVAAGLLLGTFAAIANLLTMLASGRASQAASASLGLGTAALVLHVAVLAPVAEEAAFRGLIYRHLRQAMAPLVAMGLSAGLFAVMHAGLHQAVWAFLLGIIAAFAYEQTKSIVTPMLIHALFNAVPIGVAVARAQPTDVGPIWLVVSIIALIFTFAARRASRVMS